MSAPTMEQKAANWAAAGRRMTDMNAFGALHIFVEDGNVDADSINRCMADPDIKDDERQFAQWMLDTFNEDERAAIWELTNGSS